MKANKYAKRHKLCQKPGGRHNLRVPQGADPKIYWYMYITSTKQDVSNSAIYETATYGCGVCYKVTLCRIDFTVLL